MSKFEIGAAVPKPFITGINAVYSYSMEGIKMYLHSSECFSNRVIYNIHGDLFMMEGDCDIYFNKNDFKFEKEFVLPEKWCVKFNYKEVVDYCNKYGACKPYYYHSSSDGVLFAHFPSFDGGRFTTSKCIEKGYTEITFEQFKKYVIKEDERKIIGYKIVKKEYIHTAEYICEIQSKGVWKENFEKKGWMFQNPSNHQQALKDAGVLDLWFEPVYEEIKKDKEFKLTCDGGCFHLTVTEKGLWYPIDIVYLDPEVILSMINPPLREHMLYTFIPKVSHLDMGCKKNVPVQDILPLIKYWEDNFKK